MKVVLRFGVEDISLTWVIGDITGAEVEEPGDLVQHTDDHPRRAQSL